MEKLILKVGDRVMVRKDLGAYLHSEIPFSLHPDMTRWAGEIVTIDSVAYDEWYTGGACHKLMRYGFGYDGDWYWNIYMFSHVLAGNRLVPITEKDDWRDW